MGVIVCDRHHRNDIDGGYVDHWGLFVVELRGAPQAQHWRERLLDEVYGTREQAMATLCQHAARYQTNALLAEKRRLVLEENQGYLLVLQGRRSGMLIRFFLRRVVWESAPAKTRKG